MKLYSFRINIETMETEESTEDIPDEVYTAAGYATYNEDGFEDVYAESLVSLADARQLVFEKCYDLGEKFRFTAMNITKIQLGIEIPRIKL